MVVVGNGYGLKIGYEDRLFLSNTRHHSRIDRSRRQNEKQIPGNKRHCTRSRVILWHSPYPFTGLKLLGYTLSPTSQYPPATLYRPTDADAIHRILQAMFTPSQQVLAGRRTPHTTAPAYRDDIRTTPHTRNYYQPCEKSWNERTGSI